MITDRGQKRKQSDKSKAAWVLIQDHNERRISYILDFANTDIDHLKYDDRLQFLLDFERYIFRRVFRTGDFDGQIILDKGPSPLDLLDDENFERIKKLQIEINKFLESLAFALQKNVNHGVGSFIEARLEIDCRVSVCETESGGVISIFTTPTGSDTQRLMFELLSLFADVPVDYIHKCEFCVKLFYKKKKAMYCSKKCMVNMNTKRYRERNPEAFKLSQQKRYEKKIGEKQAKSLVKRRLKKNEPKRPTV